MKYQILETISGLFIPQYKDNEKTSIWTSIGDYRSYDEALKIIDKMENDFKGNPIIIHSL